MAVPTRTPLGTTQLNRDWYLDVNIGTTGSPNWVGVFGITEFQPNLEPGMQDSSDFDSGGYGSDDVTELKFSLEFKVRRGPQGANPLEYDPGQEVLRAAAEALGTGNRVHIRWYEMGVNGPREEAYDGFANVQWKPEGGAGSALRSVAVTLGGQGKRNLIAHPDDATPPAPVIASITPSTGIAAAGGALLILQGTNLSSATAVTINAVALNAADWEYVNGAIAFKASAQAAGSRPVTVTNPGGTSAAFNITYV